MLFPLVISPDSSFLLTNNHMTTFFAIFRLFSIAQILELGIEIARIPPIILF